MGTKTTPKGPRQRENQKQISQKSSGDGKKKKKEEKEEEEEKVGTRIRLGLKPNRRINKKGYQNPFGELGRFVDTMHFWWWCYGSTFLAANQRHYYLESNNIEVPYGLGFFSSSLSPLTSL